MRPLWPSRTCSAANQETNINDSLPLSKSFVHGDWKKKGRKRSTIGLTAGCEFETRSWNYCEWILQFSIRARLLNCGHFAERFLVDGDRRLGVARYCWKLYSRSRDQSLDVNSLLQFLYDDRALRSLNWQKNLNKLRRERRKNKKRKWNFIVEGVCMCVCVCFIENYR